MMSPPAVRRLALAAVVPVAALVLVGCSEQLGDRPMTEDVVIQDMDSVRVFRNIDQFPNIARVCVDGVAFATTSSSGDGPAIVRVPEWDGSCPPAGDDGG